MSENKKMQIFSAKMREDDSIEVMCAESADSARGFKKVVFPDQSLLYAKLKKRLGDNDEWACEFDKDDQFVNAVKFDGGAEKVACDAHYAWMKNSEGKIVKRKLDGKLITVRAINVCWIAPETRDSVFNSYISRTPAEFFLEEEGTGDAE